MIRAGRLALVVVLGLGTLVTGCLDRELKPLVPCTVSGVVRKVKVSNVEKVDLLLMIDNSNSMTEEQASLATEIPRMINILASGDTTDPPDGVQDFPPVKDLHVGVITSDMGTGGFRVPTCVEPNFGDDGILRTVGNTSIPGCAATYPPFLSFMPAMGGSPSAFAMDVTCVARMGTGGCGFEQQLEATIKALLPSMATISPGFVMGSVGHGDRENSGFLRPDSLLVVMMLTDEEDCSALDPALFDPMSATYTGDLNLRCFMYPTAVHPVSRYTDALLSLRADNPDLLIFAAITGIPPDLSTAEGTNFDMILADDRMREQVDTTSPTPRLVPSCNVPGRGIAFPPRRIVTLAQQLDQRDANGIIQSICQANFAPALNAIIEKIADVLRGACLPRPLNRDASGLVNCDVVQVLPLAGDFTRCDQLTARGVDPTPVRIEDSGAQVCKINQLAAPGAVPTGQGWYYDDFSTDVREACPSTPHRISFTTGASPPTGAEVRLECLQAGGVVLGGGGEIGIGTPCAADPTICGRTAMVGLVCDMGTGGLNTCQVSCTSDSQCPSSFVCNTNRVDAMGAPIGVGSICQNPTCGG